MLLQYTRKAKPKEKENVLQQSVTHLFKKKFPSHMTEIEISKRNL